MSRGRSGTKVGARRDRGRRRDDVDGLAFDNGRERIMLRSMPATLRLIAMTAAVTPALAAQGDNRPVVVVFSFANSSIGARSDYDGLSTGIQDLLITDLASSPKVRVVDRSRISDLLQEQNLARNGQLDPQTAIRLGKILGAQYAVT